MQPFAREAIERCGVDRMRSIVHETRVERQAEQTGCRADLHPSPDRAGNDTRIGAGSSKTAVPWRVVVESAPRRVAAEIQARGWQLIDECIHGLEGQRCDQCFPKAVPIAATTTKSRSVPRATPGRRASTRPLTLPTDDVGEQRLYHITHLSNLASIVAQGELRADANDAKPVIDISADDTRELRRTVVTNLGGRSVASYVPFFLAPDSTMFRAIRSGDPDSRLSIDPDEVAPTDFIMFVSSVKAVTDLGDVVSFAVTDGDATDATTRFAMTNDSAERMLRGIRADKDSPVQFDAEFLVGDAVSLELVTVIGVAHDRARAQVKAALRGSSFSPRVSVYPPWFQREEAAG